MGRPTNSTMPPKRDASPPLVRSASTTADRQPSELLFVSCLTGLVLAALPGLSRPPSRCLCALASRLPGRSADSACWAPEDCLPSLRSPEPAAGMPGVGCSVNWRPAPPPHLEVPPPPLFDVEAEPRWSEVAPALVAAAQLRATLCVPVELWPGARLGPWRCMRRARVTGTTARSRPCRPMPGWWLASCAPPRRPG